ncbi:MAG: hypothetical protein RQM95_12335 [Syntrophaceticus schinkii]
MGKFGGAGITSCCPISKACGEILIFGLVEVGVDTQEDAAAVRCGRTELEASDIDILGCIDR